MSQLNCEVGDLAITVKCSLPENLGNIVRVVSAIGMKKWSPSESPLFTWQVEIATEHGWLAYEYETYSETLKSGPVPDQCLRRITPPKGYLLEEFADAEPVQKNLHLIDL